MEIRPILEKNMFKAIWNTEENKKTYGIMATIFGYKRSNFRDTIETHN